MKFFEEYRRDADFMSELEAAKHMQPANAAILMLGTIVLLLVFFVVWASLSTVEELTRGSGQVVPSQDIQVLQSLEGGILAELLISEGDKVEKGQVLARISDIHFSSEEGGTEAKYLGLIVRRARLKAEAEGKAFELPSEVADKNPKQIENEQALYASRQQELENAKSILDERITKARADLAEVEAQIARLTASKALLEEELTITRKMVQQKAMPKLDAIRLERELSDISGQIVVNEEKRKALRSELSVAQKERKNQDVKFRSQALKELSTVETEISALEENLKSISDRVYRTDLRAPVDGVVNKIALKTIGGVIEPAMRLIEIVPTDDELKVMAKVRPDQIAFLRPGQDVKVKITAYDPQKYGSLDGKLVRLGANSITDPEGNIFFEVEVRTDKNYMGDQVTPLPITPGMVAEVEIITGERTIMAYLMKPFLRASERVFTER